MFSNILVHIPTERPARPVTDVAVSLANVRQAHVDAIAIGFASTNSAALVSEGGAAVAAVMGVERERAQERAETAIAVFAIEAKLAGIAFDTRALAMVPFEAEQAIGELARLYDLTVVLQPERSNLTYDNMIPQAVLFNAGGPVLMLPYIHRGSLETRHIGIAWDGSRLAARALRDAMPFVSGAEAVTVVTVNEDRQRPGDASADRVVSHLGRRGIKAKLERLTADRGNVHNAILSIAAETDIDLLVMGGYGHSRMQERILGGVTRGMFDSMTVPVLMSH